MFDIVRIEGTKIRGVYFNKPDGTLGATTVSQIHLSDMQNGHGIIVNGATTVSCLRNISIPYYGFTKSNVFSASALYLSRSEQPHYFDFNNTICISKQHGQDIQCIEPNGLIQPYYNHDQTAFFKFTEEYTGDWWVCFVVWCSSAAATGNSFIKNEYLYLIPQQTILQCCMFSP